MSGNPGVEAYLYLLDEAFEGHREHSLMANLRAVEAAHWWRVPAGGERTIADIAGHIGSCYYVYDDYAFGGRSLDWVSPPAHIPELTQPGEASVTAIIEWLREGHARLRTSVAALSDTGLLTQRMTNWGEPAETRWIIASMIEHGLYHAGEINHIRSLFSGNDRWAFLED